MKKIFWIFTIRKRIKKAIIRTVKEQAYFEDELIRYTHSGRPDPGNYLSSMVKMKKEVASNLRILLYIYES